LKIEKEFIIDTEHRALAALGLIDIRAFGQLGQGPGEFQFPSYQGINSSDQILIWDSGALKLLVFDSRGDLRTETRLGMNVPALGAPIFLENGWLLL
jgi:hypothetical protein